jgi:hypothetical protein
MLPEHIPASCLPRILKDFASLIEKCYGPDVDPSEWIVGCAEEGRDAIAPWEYDSAELQLNPAKRLAEGEELGIRLHTTCDGEPMTLIDGLEYLPTVVPSNDDDSGELGDAEDEEWLDFPSEPGFFAIGIRRKGKVLHIRPVGVFELSNPGGSCFRTDDADFPPRFMERIAQYLASLT